MPHPSAPLRVVASCVLILSAAPGCSFIKTRGPPPNYRPLHAAPQCTTDRTPPKVDAAIGGAILALGGLGLAAGRSDSNSPTDQEARQSGLISVIATTAFFAASSAFGFIQTNRCDKASALWVKAETKRQEEARALAEAARLEAQKKAEAAAEEAKRIEQERRAAEEARRQEEKAEQERQRQETEQRVASNRAAPKLVAHLQLINAYTESLFRIDMVLPDSAEEFPAAFDLRVDTQATETLENAISVRQGQRAFVRIAVMSLGKWTDFGLTSIYIKPGGTFIVAYDWDPATAKFRVRTGWK